jgi:hypothetical protein
MGLKSMFAVPSRTCREGDCPTREPRGARPNAIGLHKESVDVRLACLSLFESLRRSLPKPDRVWLSARWLVVCLDQEWLGSS